MTPSFVVRHLPAWVVNGVTVTAGLALVQLSIGLAAGVAAAQAAIATAVCASLADVVTTTPRVARRVGVAVIGSTAASTLFLAIRPVDALAIPVVALIVLATMLLLSWGPKAGSVSFATGLSLVFAMSLPASETFAWPRFAWGLAGSLGYWVWAVATAWLLQPSWRQFALAATAQDLASLLSAIARQMAQPAQVVWQSDILDAESALAERLQAARDLVFAGATGRAGPRDTAILLHLIDLRDLAMASNLEGGLQPATHVQAQRTGAVVDAIADAMRQVATRLRTGRDPAVVPRIEAALEQSLARLADTAAGASSLLRNKLQMLQELQRLLGGDEAPELPCEHIDLRRFISHDEWRLSAVAANLRLDAPVFRHALRTCITATVAYAVARNVPWMPHPQWVVLTVLAVMQGNLALTLTRRNARMLGTLAGCVAVLVLVTANRSPAFLAACFLVASGVAHAFFGVRYSVTAAAAAVMALLQAHLAAPDAGFSTLERFGDTVAGALLGGAATWLLPTWERRGLASALRQAVTALRAYAAEATSPPGDAAAQPRFARQRAYDAIRMLAAMRTRSLAEPADVRVPVPQLTSWLAAAYALMGQLSNLRLGLALHARTLGTPAFDAALAAVAREIDAVLASGSLQARARPLAEIADERALATLPHLLPRARRALEEAGRVAAHAAGIEALVTTAQLGDDAARPGQAGG